jgi:chitinase
MRRIVSVGRAACALALATLFALSGCVSPNPGNGDNNQNFNAPRGVDELNDSLRNRAPIAVAGEDRVASPGDIIMLDARASSDPDGDRLTYIWQQIGDGPQVEFDSSPFAVITTFHAPAVTETTALRFSLAVLDGFSASFDEVQITVAAAAQ